jgi:hypothetical protein
MPTHRRGLLACARIVQACSWAGPNIEVIVRDNSGDAEKRKLLETVRNDHCNIIFAGPCESLENFSEILRIAKGEFVFCVADDDYCFDHGIAAVPQMLDQFGGNPAVIGMTGAYAVENSQGSAVVAYPDVDSDDVATRINGYLNYTGANVLVYSVLRRALVERLFAFMNAMPHYFSFHDQIHCLIYLLSGKFLRLKRLLYLYDVGIWEAPESAQQRDLDFYKVAGLDPAINKLHWFLCGFEGAVLALNAEMFSHVPQPQRQKVADRWFSAMFARFVSQKRLAFDSAFGGEADRLCEKLRTSTGQLSFQGMLAEISGFIALSSPQQAERYFAFWDGVINRRTQTPPRRAAAS